MPALELLAGHATAPSTTFTALTMSAGLTLAIRNARVDSKSRILQAWMDAQTGGNLRIRSPRMHDNVQGVRLVNVASEIETLLPAGVGIPVESQDVVTVELTGSPTAGDIEGAAMLVYYEDLPGIAGRFIDKDELDNRIETLMTVENTIATGTAGGFSGSEALNAEFDLMKANTDYALLGYLVSAECLAVRYIGADTGNLGVGGPGSIESKGMTAEWFVKLSREHKLPLIPVFNSANKAGILVDAFQDENGADVAVTSIFAQLRS